MRLNGICDRCGAAFEKDALFCSHCGAKRKENSENLDEGLKEFSWTADRSGYCKYCGRRLRRNEVCICNKAQAAEQMREKQIEAEQEDDELDAAKLEEAVVEAPEAEQEDDELDAAKLGEATVKAPEAEPEKETENHLETEPVKIPAEEPVEKPVKKSEPDAVSAEITEKEPIKKTGREMLYMLLGILLGGIALAGCRIYILEKNANFPDTLQYKEIQMESQPQTRVPLGDMTVLGFEEVYYFDETSVAEDLAGNIYESGNVFLLETGETSGSYLEIENDGQYQNVKGTVAVSSEAAGGQTKDGWLEIYAKYADDEYILIYSSLKEYGRGTVREVFDIDITGSVSLKFWAAGSDGEGSSVPLLLADVYFE